MGFEQTTYAIKPEHLAHWTMAAVGDWRVTLLCHTPQYFLLIIAATGNFSDVDERVCAWARGCHAVDHQLAHSDASMAETVRDSLSLPWMKENVRRWTGARRRQTICSQSVILKHDVIDALSAELL